MTRLLLDRGADPNDEETPYHAPEGYDNAAMEVLVASGKLNAESMTTMLLRKADWHDYDGVKFLLEHGAEPNRLTRWHFTAFQQSVRRDNGIDIIDAFLDHKAAPDKTAISVAARRGRGDILASLARRGIPLELEGVDGLIAACAIHNIGSVRGMVQHQPHLRDQLLARGGTLLAEFAGNANTEGAGILLDLGVDAGALYAGDGYFDIPGNSTALHVAAWRAWPKTVRFLIGRGAPVNALDGKGQTPLMCAVRACVDSYWAYRRSPDSVRALLDAGASAQGVKLPTGYGEIDTLIGALR